MCVCVGESVVRVGGVHSQYGDLRFRCSRQTGQQQRNPEAQILQTGVCTCMLWAPRTGARALWPARTKKKVSKGCNTLDTTQNCDVKTQWICRWNLCTHTVNTNSDKAFFYLKFFVLFHAGFVLWLSVESWMNDGTSSSDEDTIITDMLSTRWLWVPPIVGTEMTTGKVS